MPSARIFQKKIKKCENLFKKRENRPKARNIYFFNVSENPAYFENALLISVFMSQI